MKDRIEEKPKAEELTQITGKKCPKCGGVIMIVGANDESRVTVYYCGSCDHRE